MASVSTDGKSKSIYCSHTQTMDVAEDSDQILDLLIQQRECLLESSAHKW